MPFNRHELVNKSPANFEYVQCDGCQLVIADFLCIALILQILLNVCLERTLTVRIGTYTAADFKLYMFLLVIKPDKHAFAAV